MLIAPVPRSVIEPALPEESVIDPALIGARMLIEPVPFVLPALRVGLPAFPLIAARTAISASARRVSVLPLDQVIGLATSIFPACRCPTPTC